MPPSIILKPDLKSTPRHYYLLDILLEGEAQLADTSSTSDDLELVRRAIAGLRLATSRSFASSWSIAWRTRKAKRKRESIVMGISGKLKCEAHHALKNELYRLRAN